MLSIFFENHFPSKLRSSIPRQLIPDARTLVLSRGHSAVIDIVQVLPHRQAERETVRGHDRLVRDG